MDNKINNLLICNETLNFYFQPPQLSELCFSSLLNLSINTISLHTHSSGIERKCSQVRSFLLDYLQTSLKCSNALSDTRYIVTFEDGQLENLTIDYILGDYFYPHLCRAKNVKIKTTLDLVFDEDILFISNL